MTLEERLELISNRAKKNKDEEREKEMEVNNKTSEAMREIEKLKPRIKALITLGNKCIEEGIDFPDSYGTKKFGYGDGWHSYDFCADGIYHHVGFMECKKGCWYRGESKYNKIEYLGIENGGACGVYDFYTNGAVTFFKREETGEVKEADLKNMKKFLKEFDKFEAAFYKWIGSLMEE